MRKAALCSIVLALAGAGGLRAQEAGEAFEQDSVWDDDGQAAEDEVREGPRSVEEARQQGVAYRVGKHGGAKAAGSKDVHVVQEGDTLWGLSDHYFGNPWHWPELWSFNPEITNPHWIYPLDQLRLSPDSLQHDQLTARVQTGGGVQEKGATAGILAGTETAPSVIVPAEMFKPGSIFLRDEGYLDHEALRTAGLIVGGNEEHMMLSPSDQAYIRFRTDQDVRAGQAYTVFREMDEREREEGEQGTLVRILGTVVVRSYDREKRMARGLVTEAMDPIERGLKVAKMERRFDLVAPRRNDANVVAKIIASVQPRRLLSYGNIVFLNVGEGKGIQPGNRFFVVRRGDEWLGTIEVEDSRDIGGVSELPEYDPNYFPKEVVAELRVIKVRKNTTIALVTRSDTDLKLGDVAEMRVGF